MSDEQRTLRDAKEVGAALAGEIRYTKGIVHRHSELREFTLPFLHYLAHKQNEGSIDADDAIRYATALKKLAQGFIATVKAQRRKEKKAREVGR